ncbi:helicase [Tritrichomonas foetus]|uniref:DNA replication ATP-dependent helicase/nuclease n=1 Tax=Tritrichomonas foetus TaxID=1144522 RepID=A0A1J4KLA8_9EUKA|nr:helicase [Tritrichomonas foetus]|eukprot:OHT11922.1 helicase [Tritrichomonas foetus]
MIHQQLTIIDLKKLIECKINIKMSSFLSDDDDDFDVDDISAIQPDQQELPPQKLPPLHEEVYAQLRANQPEPHGPPTSGFIAYPSTISSSQPLFIVVDFFEQATYDSVNYLEIVVRLWAGNGHEERFVHLRDTWKDSKLSIGDSAFVIGHWERRDETYGIYKQKLSCFINDFDGFFVLLPHVLIQGTRLAAAQECQRKAYLMDVLPSQPSNLEMFKGTIVHELIQAVLRGTLASDVEAKLDSILSKSQAELFQIHETTETIKPKLQEYLGVIKRIAEALQRSNNSNYFNPNSLSNDSNPMNNSSYKDSSSLNNNDHSFEKLGEHNELIGSLQGLPPYGCQTTNEEENLWSFQWGLKGKIDVTLKQGDHLFPLELKSGNSNRGTSPKDSHTLQLSAYIFMMKEKYKELAGNAGTIYYVKDSVSFQIAPHHVELLHIIMKRNLLAHAIAHGTVPQTTANNKACTYCNGISACAFLDSGEKVKSPLAMFLQTKLAFEPKQHFIDFYRKWEKTLLDELYITRGAQTMIWLRPLKKRIADGRAIAHLSVSNSVIDQLELNAKDKSVISSSMMQVGDYVMLTNGGTPPIIGRAIIIELVETRITLEVIESSLVGNEQDICIDKWESTTSVDICRSNLMSLFAGQATYVGSRLKDLVVDCARPHFSRLPDDVPYDPKLNEDQNIAIHTALSAQDYMLLLGMPGTGKTTALVSLIKTMVDKGNRVMIASFTHTAVDNICLKLIKQNIQFIRFGRTESLHKDIVRYSIDSIIEAAETVEDIRSALDYCQVFASTCLGCNHPLLEGRGYDICVIDEASQINLPTVLGPLSRSRRFILVGDHYQLSPITKYGSGNGEEAPMSLFRLLCETNPQALVTLRTQYRMNSEILKICNELVYGFRMRTGDPTVANARMNLPFLEIISEFDEFHQKWLEISLKPEPSVVIYDTDSVPLHERKGPVSKLNHGEAAIASAVAVAQVLCGLDPDKIGIISPYRAQVLYIRELIVKQLNCAQKYFPHIIANVTTISSKLEVHTVDKFQGRDKECIIFSSVKSNKRFSPGTHITDWQRLNVAVTRAKTKFILIGSKFTLSNSPFFAKMFKIADKDSFYELPNEIDQVDLKPFCPMMSVVPVNDGS